MRIEANDLDQPVFVDHGVSSAPGATVWAAIRPEKVHMSREKPAGNDNWTLATVRDIAHSLFHQALARARPSAITVGTPKRLAARAASSFERIPPVLIALPSVPGLRPSRPPAAACRRPR